MPRKKAIDVSEWMVRTVSELVFGAGVKAVASSGRSWTASRSIARELVTMGRSAA